MGEQAGGMRPPVKGVGCNEVHPRGKAFPLKMRHHPSHRLADKGVLKVLTDYYLKGRYPRDIKTLLAWMDRERAADLLERTEQLCKMIRKNPVFSIL
jgi:hypothetical protein